MFFTKVELHNFGIYKGTHEMTLTDKMGDRNITLIGGLNGRGKTTLHDAVLLALYGKQALKYIQEKEKSYEKLLLDHMEYEWKETGIIQNHELRHKMMVIHRKRMVEKNRSNRDIIHRVGAFLRTRLICYQETNNNIVQASMATMKNSVAVLVSLKGNVVGYIYGLKDKNGTIRVLQNSIDENYKFYSPMFRGIYDYIMENCETGELKELDFTRGDEEYKYKLGGQETQLFNYII